MNQDVKEKLCSTLVEVELVTCHKVEINWQLWDVPH